MREFARGFYHSRAWRDTQAAFMASRCYVCERCSGPARIAHHVRHLTPQNVSDLSVALDWSNLMALCIECHNLIHKGGGACAPGVRFDRDGDIIYTPQEPNDNEHPGDRRPSFQNPSKGS